MQARGLGTGVDKRLVNGATYEPYIHAAEGYPKGQVGSRTATVLAVRASPVDAIGASRLPTVNATRPERLASAA